MKKMKKVWALVLALGMVSAAGFTACGDKGGDGNVDEGNDKGEQVTLEQWTAAVTNSFTQDNVTANTFMNMRMVEVYDDGQVVYEGTGSGVIKLADGTSYMKSLDNGTVNGVSMSEMEEAYYSKNGDVYCKWYRESEDAEWDYREETYSLWWEGNSVGEIIFGDDADTQETIQIAVGLYDRLAFDETTGAYSVLVKESEFDGGGNDEFTWTFKIKDDKFYAFTSRCEVDESESPDEFGYNEEKYVFVNYGTTTIKLPNEEDGEEDGVETSTATSTVQPGTDEGQEVDETGWNAAFAAFVVADNVNIDVYIEYRDEDFVQTSIGTFYVADGKFYNEGTATSFGMTMNSKEYIGGVDGVYYSWYMDDMTGEWINERLGGDEGDFIDEVGFTALGALTYMHSVSPELIGYDDLSQTWGYVDLYAQMSYDAEKQAYVMTEDENVFEIKIVDGKVASFYISMTVEEAQGYMIEITESYTFTYGGVTIGDLPDVTEDGGYRD